MSTQRHPWWHPAGSSIAVGLVAVGAGLLFATNAQLFEDQEYRNPTNLVELAQLESAKLEDHEKAVTALRQKVDEAIDASGERQLSSATTSAEFAYLDVPVSGPALEVQLWDAPITSIESGQWDVNTLVVHQQDVEAIMNALWAGGAEAMTVQGQRMASTSGIRCVGNVLLLHGQKYSPPYAIQAIGDPEALQAALERDPQVAIYRQYVDAAGLGLSITPKETVTMPAYDGKIELSHASVMEGTG
ncbi:MAG: DUF881 domain-containing protein [Bowdeniella nasicola]|nr:DUF881 domain-containing protein [Bowdeniella nasicola]